jgi:uncharacterized surface protein with fasciclin (FAS1) repeats
MDQSKNVPATEAKRNNDSAPVMNIVDTAIAAGSFTTFVAAVKAAGLTDALAAKGPVTVFAPTDAAFKKLPSGVHDALLKDPANFKAVLSHHVVAGYFTTRDVKSGEMMTLQGSTLTTAVSASDLRVNGARVTQANIFATNGVVHGIDAVILPKNWELLAAAA